MTDARLGGDGNERNYNPRIACNKFSVLMASNTRTKKICFGRDQKRSFIQFSSADNIFGSSALVIIVVKKATIAGVM